MLEPYSEILPETSRVNSSNHLEIGGCDVVELALQFGTPLYVFDEETLRRRCAEFKDEFGRRYPSSLVIYACKAFINLALARIFEEEGLGLDVVSGGEMAIARAASFPPERVYFHGNNKGLAEVESAMHWGVGHIVVDNLGEIPLIEGVAAKTGITQRVLIRVSPGVDPHTHVHTTTGIIDSKFGLPIETGQAEEDIRTAMAAPHLSLVGLHFHLGSPIFETEPYKRAIEIVLGFAARMRARYGFQLFEFSPGGGFAIQYTRDTPAPAIGEYAEAIVSTLVSQCNALALPTPKLVVEPGRAIVGRAGVALYTVGSIKEIPSVRKYVSLDGGMGDNIRHALYGARYEAVVTNRMKAEAAERVTLAGRFCESGDVLVRDVTLPEVKPGDIIAIPASGAYCLAMASNYNATPRPAIILVKERRAHLIRRRETYEDLMRCDLI